MAGLQLGVHQHLDEGVGDEAFEPETVAERLAGLAEMFPPPVQRAVESGGSATVWAVTTGFSLASKALWVVSTSALILGFPLLFEAETDAAILQENMAMQNQQKQSQLLMQGPAGMGVGGLPPPPSS